MALDPEGLFVGIDLGTGGARALTCDAGGRIIAQAGVSLPAAEIATASPATPIGHHEQSPLAWWNAVQLAVTQVMEQAARACAGPIQVLGVCVDGTSGTLVPLDATGQPTRAAMMYNDARSAAEAAELSFAAAEHCASHGYRIESSFAIAKILWVARHEPDVFSRTARFVHQADYIVGQLTGDFSTTDYSNALKTGYDLIQDRWPAWLARLDGVQERLPDVVAPGTPIGQITASAAAATGLPRGAKVVSGATDGVAACLASGARNIGDYNTTLGTTLVFKGVSREIVLHPDGLIYSHKLPGGVWLPGAASNTGAEWIASWFAGQDPRALDRAAADRLPCRTLAYPLVRKGERFPLLAPTATGFITPETADPAERFAACLAGVAMIERLAYETLDQACKAAGGDVFVTGGGSRSDIWTQCRADITGRAMHRPATPESAFGSAILAATGAHYGDLSAAIAGMVRIERTFEPRRETVTAYDDLYGRFLAELASRGYLDRR